MTAASQSKHNNISVDELIPMFVFVIIKSGLTHWIATLHYLKNFIFTEFSDGSDKGVDSFLITTLEAAILYIESIDLHEFKKATTTTNLSQTEVKRHFTSKEQFVDYLFSKILAEDEIEIIKLLKTDKDIVISNQNVAVTSSSDEHFDNNSKITIGRQGNENEANRLSGRRFSDIDDGIDECDIDEIDVISKFPESRINLQSGHGIGGIHIAAIHGLPKMLNLLLALGVDLHIKDENNYTPLHYASSRGQQNTLLLLLHAGADINALTSDKNTALHLSCLNGHGNCVKALLYYSDHLKVRIDRNATNKFGDTALHMATKWGFSEIIETLLEYGIRRDIKNRAGHIALDYAHSSRIANHLQNAFVSIEQQADNTSDWDGQSTCSSLSASTNSLNQVHEIFRGCFSTAISDGAPFISRKTNNDKVVSAIKNDDIKLAFHFLGIELPNEMEINVCHPLCDCDKCKHINEYLSRKQNNYNNATRQMIRSYDPAEIDELSSADGLSPLHAAIQMQNVDLIERILEMGAKLHIQTKAMKYTAIHLAIITKSIEIVNLILNCIRSNDEFPAIDIQDANGDTALHLAVKLTDFQLVDALLKHEPNTKTRNVEGKTALDIAKSSLQLNTVQRLEMAEKNDFQITDSD